MYVIIYIFYIFLTDFVYSWFYASWKEGDYPNFLRPVSVPKRYLQKTAQRGPSTPCMSKPSVAHLATARGSHCNLLQQWHSTTALLNAWILAWPPTKQIAKAACQCPPHPLHTHTVDDKPPLQTCMPFNHKNHCLSAFTHPPNCVAHHHCWEPTCCMIGKLTNTTSPCISQLCNSPCVCLTHPVKPVTLPSL